MTKIVHNIAFTSEQDFFVRFQEDTDLMATPKGEYRWELFRHEKGTGRIIDSVESYSLGGVVHLAKVRGWIRPLETSDDTRRYLVSTEIGFNPTSEHSFETLVAIYSGFSTYTLSAVQNLQVGQDVQVYEYNVKRIS